MYYKYKITAAIIITLIMLILFSSSTKSQEKFLLTESEMSNYDLERQSINDWVIDEGNKLQSVIQQKWRLKGDDTKKNIFVEYCEFHTEPEAAIKTAYAAQSFATPSVWGFSNGSIVGDASWVFINGRGIFFVRSNVGIKINLWMNFDENELPLLLSLCSKLLNKIEINLSSEILSLEATARQKQISMAEYKKITDPIVNSELMNGFSLQSTWDSKWLIDSENIAMGIRREWKDNHNAIVAIDICQFNSDSVASNAASLQKRITYNEVVDLDNLDSLTTIINDWQNKWKSGLPKNLFSVIGLKGNIAIHVYQFSSSGIDKNFFYSIVAKLSKQI